MRDAGRSRLRLFVYSRVDGVKLSHREFSFFASVLQTASPIFFGVGRSSSPSTGK